MLGKGKHQDGATIVATVVLECCLFLLFLLTMGAIGMEMTIVSIYHHREHAPSNNEQTPLMWNKRRFPAYGWMQGVFSEM